MPKNQLILRNSQVNLFKNYHLQIRDAFKNISFAIGEHHNELANVNQDIYYLMHGKYQQAITTDGLDKLKELFYRQTQATKTNYLGE